MSNRRMSSPSTKIENSAPAARMACGRMSVVSRSLILRIENEAGASGRRPVRAMSMGSSLCDRRRRASSYATAKYSSNSPATTRGKVIRSCSSTRYSIIAWRMASSTASGSISALARYTSTSRGTIPWRRRMSTSALTEATS